MTALIASVLFASFIGSVHCVAMCGGFVGFVSRSSTGASPWTGPVAWQAGRLAGYLALGALAGLLGAGLEQAGGWLGVHRAAAVAAGSVMIAWGLWTLLGLRRGVAAPPTIALPLHRAIGRITRALSAWSPALRATVLGLATALLPCGFLWAFVATAAATGDAARGALVMLVFWAGTAPALAGLAAVARRALGPLERRLPLVTAAVLVVIGLLTVAGRIGPLASPPPQASGASVHDCH